MIVSPFFEKFLSQSLYQGKLRMQLIHWKA
jgi:hypothetical protein